MKNSVTIVLIQQKQRDRDFKTVYARENFNNFSRVIGKQIKIEKNHNRSEFSEDVVK